MEKDSDSMDEWVFLLFQLFVFLTYPSTFHKHTHPSVSVEMRLSYTHKSEVMVLACPSYPELDSKP